MPLAMCFVRSASNCPHASLSSNLLSSASLHIPSNKDTCRASCASHTRIISVAFSSPTISGGFTSSRIMKDDISFSPWQRNKGHPFVNAFILSGVEGSLTFSGVSSSLPNCLIQSSYASINSSSSIEIDCVESAVSHVLHLISSGMRLRRPSFFSACDSKFASESSR